MSWPFRRIFGGLTLIDAFHHHGVSTRESGGRRSSRETRWKRWLSWPIQLIMLPSLLYRRARRRGKQRELLFLIPALALLLFLSYVGYRNVIRRGAIENRYLAGARAAVDRADFELAKKYVLRTLDPDRMTSDQTVRWAALLGQTGESKKATELLTALAPVGTEGYGPAHQLLADNICRQYLFEGAEPDLEELRWHLQQSEPKAVSVKLNWSTYYRASGKPIEAVDKILEAAKEQPDLYLTAAQVCREELTRSAESPGTLTAQERDVLEQYRRLSLMDAKRHYGQLVRDNRHNSVARIRQAEAMGQLKEFAEARIVLNEGLEFSREPALIRARSQIEVLAFSDHWRKVARQFPIPPKDLVSAIVLLEAAVELDPTNVATYVTLVDWQHELETLGAAQSQLYYEALTERITSDDPTPEDYLLSARWSWYHANQDEALKELHHAWRMQPNLGRIVHRWAEAEAVSDSADLEWAAAMIEACLREPNPLPEYHRVAGRIYQLAGRSQEAIDQVLPLIGNDLPQAPLHQILALAYDDLGQPQLARRHQELARSLATSNNEPL